jgi:hypothetical protein
MHCALNADQATAQQEIGNAATTPWTNYGDLVRYGWIVADDHDPFNAVGQFTLADTFSKLNINDDANELYVIRHSRQMVVNGVTYEVPTELIYFSSFGCSSSAG